MLWAVEMVSKRAVLMATKTDGGWVDRMVVRMVVERAA